MEFTSLELSAMVNLGLAMASADGLVDNTETKAISKELCFFGVKLSDGEIIIKRAMAMNNVDALAVVSQMNVTQKKYVTGFLAVIMDADGIIEDSEIKMWSLISAICELPTMTIQQALDFWREN